MNPLSPFAGNWISAQEFAGLSPLDLFHPEEQPFTPPLHREELKNFHMVVEKVFSHTALLGAHRVEIRITADDYYKLYLNGQLVGQGPAPGYYFGYYYNQYDITSLIQPGENRIQVKVYYQGLINRVWNSGDYRQGMIADILADGKPVMVTGPDWQYTRDCSYTGNRTTGYDTLFLEDVDSRIPLTGWQPAAIRQVDYTFRQPAFPSLEVYEHQPAATCWRNGILFVDFGEEVVGNLKITAQGRAGDRIAIRCGEELNADGSVRWQMRCNCDYQEWWTLREGENLLEQYDYKGFRYLELCPQGEIHIKQVTAIVRHFPFPTEAAALKSENPILQQVFDLCKNGVRWGSQESFLDCPTREKGQYTGDLTITGAAHLLLTGDVRLLRRAIDLQVDSLAIAPGMLAVAPGSWMQEIADYALQFPLSVWRYYVYTGDLDFLRQMLPHCQAVVQWFRQYERPDGLLEAVTGKWNLVDWPENLRDGYDFPLTRPVGPGCHNVINAFYLGCVGMVEQMEKELGLPTENRLLSLKEAFHRAFFRPALGRYADSETSQHCTIHANCIPAFYGLISPEFEASVADYLVERGMACGVYMAFFLLKALARMGRYEAVWQLLCDQGIHSWYNMVREGGTTCFEAWGKNQKWNTSLCHPWASAPIPVLIEDLAGFGPQKPGKGWGFHPRFPAGSGKIQLSVPSPEGTLVLNWE